MMRLIVTKTAWAVAACWFGLCAASALAADPVSIGAILPMGPDAKAAIETALDVVNGKHAAMPVLSGQGGGLDRLNGAELRVIYADKGGDPAAASAEAERLVTAEHVVALIGGADDATAVAVGQVAERLHIPFLSPVQSPATPSDLEWLFRLGPTPELTAGSIFEFLGDRGKSIALVWDDTPFGRDNAAAQRKAAEASGAKIVADLKLAPGASSLAAEALVIAGAKPSAVIPSVGAEHAASLLRALAEQQAAPIVMAAGGGFCDPGFPAAAGPLAEGVFRINGFIGDAATARPGLPMLDAAFRARAGKPLDERSARVLTGTLLLADVINRAGTTKPIELRAAFMDTNTPGDEMLLAWPGIRFDNSARNVLATPAIEQVQGGVFRVVAPEGLAAVAAVWK